MTGWPKIALTLDYAGDQLAQIDAVVDLEARGLLDEVWVAEAYGSDSVSIMGFLAARTQRVVIAAGVLPVYTRSPALIAQTAAGLDRLSGGRAVLGLGTSGPGVIEGLHGIRFERPLAHLRETIEVCRAAWRGERIQSVGPRPAPLVREGRERLRPLKLIGDPPRDRIPIVIAALRPRGVALAAELAEGWYPLLYDREYAAQAWEQPLADGRARRASELEPLRVIAGMACAIGDEAELAPAREAVRRELALYLGGMGARGQNYYAETVARFGFSDAVEQIQERFRDGRRAEAAAAVPDEMIARVALLGEAKDVAARVRALGRSGVDTVALRAAGQPPTRMLERLAAGWRDEHDSR